MVSTNENRLKPSCLWEWQLTRTNPDGWHPNSLRCLHKALLPAHEKISSSRLHPHPPPCPASLLSYHLKLPTHKWHILRKALAKQRPNMGRETSHTVMGYSNTEDRDLQEAACHGTLKLILVFEACVKCSPLLSAESTPPTAAERRKRKFIFMLHPFIFQFSICTDFPLINVGSVGCLVTSPPWTTKHLD